MGKVARSGGRLGETIGEKGAGGSFSYPCPSRTIFTSMNSFTCIITHPVHCNQCDKSFYSETPRRFEVWFASIRDGPATKVQYNSLAIIVGKERLSASCFALLRRNWARPKTVRVRRGSSPLIELYCESQGKIASLHHPRPPPIIKPTFSLDISAALYKP